MQAPTGYKYFDHDPISGIWTWFKYDDATGDMDICKTQDPTLMLDGVAEQKYNAKGTLGKDGLVKLGHITEGLRQKTINEEGWDPYRAENVDRVFKKFMGDWAYLRIAEGFQL